MVSDVFLAGSDDFLECLLVASQPKNDEKTLGMSTKMSNYSFKTPWFLCCITEKISRKQSFQTGVIYKTPQTENQSRQLLPFSGSKHTIGLSLSPLYK